MDCLNKLKLIDSKGRSPMNNLKKISALTTAVLMSALAINPAVYAEEASAKSYDMGVTVNVGDKGKAISPYIFGINEHGLDEGLPGPPR